MDIDGLGRFVVSPNEQITVLVTKAKDIFLATFSNVTGANDWTNIIKPTPLSEQRTLTAPAAKGTDFNFAIQYDFRPDASGAHDMTDQYTIEITGNISGAGNTDPILPPPIKIRSYSFVTT
jgi:hypothetical protein